jgi:ribonucleoside-diphosphate reductase alpha chain
MDYEWRTSTIKNEDGSSASQSVKLETPRPWSQRATDIMAQKYVRRSDVPLFDDQNRPILDKNGNQLKGRETSIKQVIERLAGCWKYWGEKHNYFDSSEDAQAFYDETTYMLLHQMASPNSPQWFNTGLAYKYGIMGSPQGHWFVDPEDKKLKPGMDAFSRPQPHACFIQSVDDDLLGENGIYSLLTREGRIFKFGSGTGTNFSNIRSAGEPLASGGVSSGLMSFLRIYDRAAGSIKSGGTTRRAAKMVALDIDHPEIETFISWKSKEERKVAAMVAGSKIMHKQIERILEATGDSDNGNGTSDKLVSAVRRALDQGLPESIIQRALQQGFQGITDCNIKELNTEFEGDAYATVSGQNSNNSIRVPHKFMQQLDKDGSWDLVGRVANKAVKTVKAKDLWDQIVKAAWECADPGLQFDDTINDWHTCPQDGRIRSSNPCSEYMFLDDTACNLASLNLGKFLDEEGNFQINDFEHAVRIWTLVLEISVTMAQFPSREIARKSYEYRTLGLGYANLGSVLMRMGVPYDSEKAAAFAGAISALMCGKAYTTSAEMARDHGPFECFERNRESMLRVIRNHRRAAHNAPQTEYEKLTIFPVGLNEKECHPELIQAAREAWDQALSLGEAHGYRNAQVTVVAPTGTIGLLMDCDTTGIEPDFALVKFKKLSGGGFFKIANQSLTPALRKLGYTPQQINDIELFCKGHGTLENAPHINVESLEKSGLSHKVIQKIDQALPGAFQLTQAFNPVVLGPETRKKLRITEDKIFSPDFNLLRHLGFNDREIEEANRHICGTQMVEGAPHLLKEHYPVFDCANTCGKEGTRFIAPKGHLRLMAAAQPFITGAISKTFNLPGESTLEDIKDIYKTAWEGGLKAVSIYRDNSKLSQPLSSSRAMPAALKQAKMAPPDTSEHEQHLQFESRIKTEEPEWPQVKRRKLPARRTGFTQEGQVGGHKLFLRTGEYPDGSLGEIFIDMYKEGASYRGLLNCFAVLASKALQYGVPLKELVDSFTFTRFEPSGTVTGHEHIKSATSILDFAFRALGHHYLNIQEFLHVKPSAPDLAESRHEEHEKKPQEELPQAETAKTAVSSGANKAYIESRLAGYTGESCLSCGSLRVRRNGTCMLCDDCGTTSGCS